MSALLGFTVLVTGANGLLGYHIADQFLAYGYKVHGTVRDLEKSSWLADVFVKNYGKGSFELVKVPDMAAKSAFAEAVKDVSIFVHSASILTFNFNPHNVIPDVIAGAMNALQAAYAESSAKRFVFTSSSAAAVSSSNGAAGIKTPERAASVYSASKTQAEQEVWKYHKEHQSERPDLVVNTVLPNVNFGKSVDPLHQGFASSAKMPALLYNRQVVDFHHMVPRHTGRLHVAAGIFKHVQCQRIFGIAYRFSWDSILEIVRKIEPEKTFPDNFSGGEDSNEIEPHVVEKDVVMLIKQITSGVIF
ncbi:hypothetical protein BKA60DRAFT_600049 [Fusarium oxysporum]|nr:hypothetical protein BKA60DRAFT_600049 [Fusarium oxysporum]